MCAHDLKKRFPVVILQREHVVISFMTETWGRKLTPLVWRYSCIRPDSPPASCSHSAASINIRLLLMPPRFTWRKHFFRERRQLAAMISPLLHKCLTDIGAVIDVFLDLRITCGFCGGVVVPRSEHVDRCEVTDRCEGVELRVAGKGGTGCTRRRRGCSYGC